MVDTKQTQLFMSVFRGRTDVYAVIRKFRITEL